MHLPYHTWPLNQEETHHQTSQTQHNPKQTDQKQPQIPTPQNNGIMAITVTVAVPVCGDEAGPQEFSFEAVYSSIYVPGEIWWSSAIWEDLSLEPN